MKVSEWINTQSLSVADSIAHINRHQILKQAVTGFGLKGRVTSLLDHLKAALFPNIYENKLVEEGYMGFLVAEQVNKAAILLEEIIQEVLTNQCEKQQKSGCDQCAQRADEITIQFMNSLPSIREMLSTDLVAAYNGDPAAIYLDEILLSYPSIEAVTVHRLAHRLFTLKVPIIPRIMSELAHQATGIDIHPGATIGEYFFIDHGTGVVVGETCTIGKNVKIYQGVTLGAKSFELDDQGNPIKGVKRHPDIEDDVIIYSGATILGGDTVIGRGSVIGGNVWLTKSVPPNSVVNNAQPSPIIK